MVLRERRQVHELPEVRWVVTEQQALQVRCPACAQVSVGDFPALVPSRAQYGPHLRAVAVYLVQEQLVPLGRVPGGDGVGARGSRDQGGAAPGTSAAQ